MAFIRLKEISRDPAVGEAYLKDPLVKQVGTLRCITDMFDRVSDYYYSSQVQNLTRYLGGRVVSVRVQELA